MTNNNTKTHQKVFQQQINKKQMISSVRVQNICSITIQIIVGKRQFFNQLFWDLVYPKIRTKNVICGKIFNQNEGGIRQFYSGFRCQNCLYENNSIYCKECFEKSNHQGHSFSKIQFIGGCCDCGDDQKLKAESFCLQHRNQQMTCQIDKNIQTEYIDQVGKIIDFIIQQNSNINCLKQKQRLDLCGEAFLTSLLAFNEDSQISRQMTVAVLKTYSQQQFYSNKKEKQSRLRGLYSLTELKKTSLVIIELIIKLFQVKGFRKYVTCIVCELYDNNDYHHSVFRNLHCQLFTSHKTISQLIRQKQMKPLIITLKQTDVKKNMLQISAYYQDLLYLLNLYPPSNTQYALYHLKITNVNNLFLYRTLATQIPQINAYYGIQKGFLQIFMKFCKIIYALQAYDACKKPLFELAHFIFAQNNCFEKTDYCSQERAFALLTFIYFGLNIDQLDEKQKMIEFLYIIGFKKDDLFKTIQNVLNAAFQRCAFYALIIDDPLTIQQKKTYYEFLFKTENRLIALDSIFLQILIKISHFIGHCYNVFQNKIFCNMITIFQIKCNSLSLSFALDDFFDVQKILKQICNFIALILEFLAFSKSSFQLQSLFDKKNQKKMFQLFIELLSSVKKIQKKQFNQLLNMFVQNKEGLLLFLKQFQCQNEPTKICIDSKPQRKKLGINLKYFRSLRVQLNKINLSQFENSNRSYMRKSFPCYDFKYFAEATIKMLKIFQNYFSSQKLCNKFKELYHLLVRQIWKVFIFSPVQTQPILKQFFQKIKLENLPQDLIFQIKTYFKILLDTSSKQQKNQIFNQKLKLKKKLFQDKKLTNINNFINQFQSSVQKEKDNICSICKSQITSLNLMFICNSQITIFKKNKFLIIKTCNHPVHQNCFTNRLQKNTSQCPLCLFYAQFFLPTQNQEKTFKHIEDIKNILINKYDIKTSFQSLVFSSYIFFLLTIGLNRTEYFLRTFAPVYLVFLKSLKQSFEPLSIDSFFQFQQLEINATLFTINILFNRQINLQNKLNESALNGYLQHLIKAAFFQKSLQQNIQCQLSAEGKIARLIKRPSIDENLKDFYLKNVGLCSNCFHKTDQILICLRCESFKTCFKCQKINIRKHIKNEHLNGTIVITVNEGNLIYVGVNRHWVYPSMYEDYKNEKYQKSRFFLDRHPYHLNKKYLSLAWKHIEEQSILSQIHQEESLNYKTFDDDI